MRYRKKDREKRLKVRRRRPQSSENLHRQHHPKKNGGDIAAAWEQKEYLEVSGLRNPPNPGITDRGNCWRA